MRYEAKMVDLEEIKEKLYDHVPPDVVYAFFTIVGIGALYRLFQPSPKPIPPIKETILGDQWETNVWKQIEGIGDGNAKIENGIFKAMIDYPTSQGTAVALIQQGKQPHSWWDSPAKLKNELVISLDVDQPLILEFQGKRTSSIYWYGTDPRISDIGVLLIGDVGLDYDDPDTTKPHALYVDLWLDIIPREDVHHWQGVEGWENDYHSAFRITSMPNIGQEYEFRIRMDQQIKNALTRWNLKTFTIKTVQIYVEARASKSSIEISKVNIGVP